MNKKEAALRGLNGGVWLFYLNDSQLQFAVYGHYVNAAVVGFDIFETYPDFMKLAFVPTFDIENLKDFVVGDLTFSGFA